MSKKESEGQIFRDAIGDVTQIPSRKVSPGSPKPKADAKFTRADARAVQNESLITSPEELELEAGDELRYTRDDVTESVLRKLRRGAYRVQSEIDLHGLSIAEAKIALFEFLQECQMRELTCVRVIHGKGNRSGQRGPVIKGKVNVWLRRRSDIVAFVSTPRYDGGTGAIYVLLAGGSGS